MILHDIYGGPDGKWRVIVRSDDGGATQFLCASKGDDPTSALEAASYAASLSPHVREDEQGLWWGARSFAIEALKMARAAAEAWRNDGVA